jgi:hypothetical protein
MPGIRFQVTAAPRPHPEHIRCPIQGLPGTLSPEVEWRSPNTHIWGQGLQSKEIYLHSAEFLDRMLFKHRELTYKILDLLSLLSY